MEAEDNEKRPIKAREIRVHLELLEPKDRHRKTKICSWIKLDKKRPFKIMNQTKLDN